LDIHPQAKEAAMTSVSRFSPPSPYARLPDHVVIVDLSGTVDERDVSDYKKRIYAALETHDKIGLVIDLIGLSDMTPAAIREDIRFEVGLLGDLKRFAKVAIVSDKQFMQALVRYFAPLVPFMDMKIFAPDARADAAAFAAAIHDQENTGK
jgi:hypothetical protein